MSLNAARRLAAVGCSLGVVLTASAGSPIPGGAPPPPQRPAAAPAPEAAGSAAVKPGDYECWAFSSARMLQNFSILDGRRYRDSEDKTYGYHLEGGGTLVFEGGVLSDLGPYQVHYHVPNGRPTASFRNAQGTEVSFCEWVR